ncbi:MULTISPECIES: hypothetical protein [Flammeovirga]|uniref:Long-chain fatty acid transport protein n=1 Tax=Flammeovirga agarivorans TaxID=2726742 RepID=A0A7X8XVH0_9BACT|nr:MULTISPECIES: hypothetical protein [Flammeovirga]NLR91055.1 hypothetical protein [Flammeovirga agarivorans]
MPKKQILFILLLSIAFTSKSQTGRYWSNSFNTDASLLSGAVVGGGSGIAAIFYNPAQIADIDYQKFSISANIFSMYIFRYENGLGGGNHYGDWNFQVQPRFVAFLLRPKNWTNTSIELASFTRDNVNTELRSRTNKQLDFIDITPGPEEYLGDYYYRMDYEDYWLSIGIAKKFSNNFSIGLSGYHSYISIKYDYIIEANAYNLDNQNTDEFYVAQFKNSQSITGYTSRLLFKLGLKYEWNKWNFGLAIQSPSIKYAGESNVYREVSLQNVHNQNNELIPNMLVSEYQEDLVTNFKDPFSISFGATFSHKTSSYYFTGEYFGKLDSYLNIKDMAPGPFVSNNQLSIRTDNWLDYYAQNNQVTNFAFGYRNILTDKIELMAGFRTDFSYDKYDGGYDNQYPSKITTFSVDQYHTTIGGQFTILKTDIITGIQWSFAQGKNLRQVANFSEPVEFSPSDRIVLQGHRNNSMNMRENTLSLFLGFTYNIGQEK